MRRVRSFRLSSNAASAVLGAAVVAVLSAGTAVAVSTTAVSITNPATGVRAHVTAKQTLVTSDRDPYTGVYAKVDGAGRQVVGAGIPARIWTPARAGTALDGWGFVSVSLVTPSSGRLVVRGCAAAVHLPPGQRATAQLRYIALDDVSGEESYLPLLLSFQAQIGGAEIYFANFAGDLYPKPGTDVTLYVQRDSHAGQMPLSVSCRGELM